MRYLILAAVALLALAWYPTSCWLWPYRNCTVCSGSGRHAREDRKVFRACWWCKGAGRRLRYGRRVWNYFAARRKAAR